MGAFKDLFWEPAIDGHWEETSKFSYLAGNFLYRGMRLTGRLCVALAAGEERIAPLLDTATRFWIMDDPAVQDGSGGKIVGFHGGLWQDWEAFLAHEGIGVLICGAISRLLECQIQSAGVTVYGFRRGNLSDVCRAWIHGVLEEDAYFLPGCARRRKGLGMGGRPGYGRSGRGGYGVCGCPVCGQRWVHEPGVPCQTRVCTRCGVRLKRVEAKGKGG